MKHKALSNSPRYRDFVNGRDRALESILAKYLRATDRVMSGLLRRVQEIATRKHVLGLSIKPDHRLESQIESAFAQAHAELIYLFSRMRITVYTLSTAGEAEAIGRALGKPQKVDASKTNIAMQMHKDTPSGGSIPERVDLALFKLKSKVFAAIKTSAVLEEGPKELLSRIDRAFPKKTKQRVDARVLRRVKPVRESDRKAMHFSSGVIDQNAWQQSVEDYAEDEIPGPRGPYDKLVLFDVGSEGSVEFQEKYEWELEKEITQDFVEQVRDGQVDAANENGIKDFMWVAVIDDHTDECCSKRDGLSSSEIESQLNSGKLNADLCDASVPPAHFNCRCTPAPISNDLPDTPPPDYGSFDDWLDSQRAA